MVPERGVPCYSAKRLAFGSFRIFVLRPGIEPMPDFQGIPFFLFLTVKKLSEKLREKYREQPYTLRSDSFAHFATFAFCLRHTHIFFFFFSEPFGRKLPQVFQHVSPKKTDMSYTTAVVTKFRPGICDATLMQPWDLICRPLSGVSDCPRELGSCLTFGC